MSLLLRSLLLSTVIGTHFTDHVSSFDGPGRNFGQLRHFCQIGPCVLMVWKELAEVSARLVKIGNTGTCFGDSFLCASMKCMFGVPLPVVYRGVM